MIGISYFWFLGALLQMDVLLFGKEPWASTTRAKTGILIASLAVGIGIGSLVAGRLSGDKVELGLVPLGSIGMGVGRAAARLGRRPPWLAVHRSPCSASRAACSSCR